MLIFHFRVDKKICMLFPHPFCLLHSSLNIKILLNQIKILASDLAKAGPGFQEGEVWEDQREWPGRRTLPLEAMEVQWAAPSCRKVWLGYTNNHLVTWPHRETRWPQSCHTWNSGPHKRFWPCRTRTWSAADPLQSPPTPLERAHWCTGMWCQKLRWRQTFQVGKRLSQEQAQRLWNTCYGMYQPFW